MKGFARRLCFFLCAWGPLLLGACGGGDAPDLPDTPPHGAVGEGLRQLAIHITPVATRATDEGVVEMIRTLRIILVNQDEDTIEFNRLIERENGVRATAFVYDFLWYTPAGKKTFYLIANEASVSGDLTGLLSGYQADAAVGNLAKELEEFAFEPDYTVADGEIYLPYSSVYKDIEIGEKDFVEKEMFLVPVATKFTFRFENNRKYGVKIQGISLESVNSANWLLAQVGEPDREKKIGDTPYYWVDWLAKISEMSAANAGYGDNTEFNRKYGWISNYTIPDDDPVKPKVFVEATEDASFTVFGTKDADNGVNSCTKGPFYVPESRNPLKPDGSNGSNGSVDTNKQAYYLTIGLVDTVEGKEAPTFAEVAIANLEALFRNTHVVINVVMRQGDVEVYAEIADWNERSINGWVAEDPNAPKPDLDTQQ